MSKIPSQLHNNQQSPEHPIPKFIETECNIKTPPTCVDGRNCGIDGYLKAGQMLGGSLNIIILKAINEGKQIDKEFISKTVAQMKKLEIKVGGHTDDHDHSEGVACGCGFADNIITILQRAQQQKDEIINRIKNVYSNNPTAYDNFFGEDINVSELLSNSLNKIISYNISENVNSTGKQIVEKVNPQYKLKGNHGEQIAFINLKQGKTLNVVTLNNRKKQAFNLDLWMVKNQATKMRLNANIYVMQSLILYVATEIVLVEDKGQMALPLVTNS